MRKRVSHVLAALGLATGIVLVSSGVYMQLKAELAQVLIGYAYAKQEQISVRQTINMHKLPSAKQTIDSRIAHGQTKYKPWPWADMTVMAKITINGINNYVLSHASMRNLAFGPAHMSQTPEPGAYGNSVIIGHRDTHFAHLEHIQKGDKIKLQRNTVIIVYEVIEVSVVDQSQVSVMTNIDATALTLITCYPFNSIHPKPTKRWVVRAILTS